MNSEKISTMRSSGYRSWSTRTLQERHVHDEEDLDRQSRSQGSLRLQLHQNARGQSQLELSKRNLRSFPLEVFMFARLEVLKLGNNYFEEIPLAISRLRSLRCLQLQENRLTFLPETISNCIHLVEVNLTKNHLATLPTSIGMLKELRILRLGQNDFECLPHEIGYLDNLRYLDLHGNRLWYLPFSIGKLYRLKYLNVANNKFEHLPLPVCKILSLTILNVQGNALMNLLPDFDSLCHLEELNLAYNKFEVIPQAIFRLKLLLYLNLTGNKLHILPSAITTLKNLKVLHVQGNQVENIPDRLPNLQYLNISNNKLKNFSVVNMKRLRSLNANNNGLENIPMGVYSQPKLQTLRLNTNHIQYVSPDIVFLKRLKTLDLGNNKLTSIPQVIKELNRLDFFNVRGNNIKNNISLYSGEIIPQTDFFSKRKNFQNARQTYESTQRKSKKQKPINSPVGSLTTSYTANHRMWDSEDLLENGFTEKHLSSTVSSAYLKRKPPGSGHRSQSLPSRQRFLGHDEELASNLDNRTISDTPACRTDYQLLGICNQVEMLLNKQLLHPVLSLKGHPMGKSFSEKAIVETPSGLWRISEDKMTEGTTKGLVAMTTETFTVTPQGGWLSSSNDPNISIFLPSNAVSQLTQAQMKILRVGGEQLKQLRRENRLIANIIAVGPIVYLKNLNDNEFNHQVTITIPSLTSQHRGHLHLLNIHDDNTCVPCSSKYKNKNGYIMIQASTLSGKAATITRTKCKYKACKSVEQLLSVLNKTRHNQ